MTAILDEGPEVDVTADPGADLGVRFDTVYARHFSAVLAYAIRRVPQRQDAADVVAESFLVVWRRITEVPAEPATLPWLYAVTGNVLSNHVRGNRRRTALADRLRESITRTPQVTSTQEVPDLVAAVPRALSLLSDSDRELLQLTLWEELSPGEIAQVMDLRPSVVRNRLHRARTRLRTIMDQAQFLDAGERRP